MSIATPSQASESYEPLPGRRESLLALDSRIPNLQQKTRTSLRGIANIWQPSGYLPDLSDFDAGTEHIRSIQKEVRTLSPELLAVLIGDTVTEAGLAQFSSRLFTMYGLPTTKEGDVHSHKGNLQRWIGEWTAEENRHGVLLRDFLWLSGRVEMGAYERTVHMFLEDSMDIQIGNDPYRGFVYTSFQELATQRSHANVARLAKESPTLRTICGQIASDEGYHAKAYIEFVRIFFERDPNNMMMAFKDMMERGIVMPAHNMREIDKTGKILQPGETYQKFSDTAQHLGVYTSQDYAEISAQLISEWKVGERSEAGWKPLPMTGLNEEGSEAQNDILKRQRVIERFVTRQKPKEPEKHEWSWIIENEKK